jgi:hypothetical protein
MKKLFALAFVSLFLLHFAGVYTYFGVRLMAIRQEMKQLLKTTPDDQLELMQLTKSEYQKSLHEEDELELNGKMYDIARVELKEGIYFVYALHDAAEDNLLGFLDEVVKRSSSDKKPVPSQLLQFFSLDFISPQTNFCFARELTQKISVVYSKLYSSYQLPINSPPPKS